MNTTFATSVLIVNYNSGAFLKRCVESVLTSDVPVHIVIVDNASVDQSLNLVQGIMDVVNGSDSDSLAHRIDVIRNDKNHGFSKAVNIGFAHSKTDTFFLLNPDCVVFPRTIKELKKELVFDRQVGIVGALVFNEDGSEQRGCRRNEPTFKRSMITALKLGKRYQGVDMTYQPLPKTSVEVDAVSGAAMMINRAHFESVGGMDEDYFLHCEDLDICRKMRDAGHKVIFSPTTSVFHFKGASAVSSLFVERHKCNGMLSYYKKHYAADANRFDYYGTLISVRAHFAVTMVSGFLKRLSYVIRLGHGRHDADSIDTSMELTIKRGPPANADRETVLVTGANSDVGDFLLDQFTDERCRYIALSRDCRDSYHATNRHGVSIHWLPLSYFEKVPRQDFGEITSWISAAPIWVTSDLIDVISRFSPSRVIAFSSTSIEGKKHSESLSDQQIVKKLEQGESRLRQFAKEEKTSVVILRPTLVYGGPRNKNINLIKQFIRIFRFFPIISAGSGLRQPVHAADLARACEGLSKTSAEFGVKIYNLAGNERLTYRKMIITVFESLQMKPRIVNLSPSLVWSGLRLLRIIPQFRFLSKSMLHRMSQDLVYPGDRAQEDFQYTPRDFEP